jgi:Transposase
MAETRRKFDADFKEGAVRLVRETGKPIAQVARDLGINEGTLGNWVNADRRRRGERDGALSEDERGSPRGRAVSGVVDVDLVVFAGVDVDRAAAGEVAGRARHAVRAGGLAFGAGRTVGIGCGSWKGSRARAAGLAGLSGPRRMASWRPPAGPGQAERRPK